MEPEDGSRRRLPDLVSGCYWLLQYNNYFIGVGG